jgi:hypothetical protein
VAVKTDFWKAVKAGDRAGGESLLAAEPGLATARLDGASARARGHEGLAGRLGSEPWS